MLDWISLLPFFLAVVAVASVGGTLKPGSWYRALDKPSWTPPDWLFGPAWTVLYILIAVAGWRVWQASGWNLAMVFWCANLMFNAAWSWLMFRRHNLEAALLDAAFMLATILGFIATAWQHDTTAALLFTPYLAWTAFATALNLELVRRNNFI